MSYNRRFPRRSVHQPRARNRGSHNHSRGGSTSGNENTSCDRGRSFFPADSLENDQHNEYNVQQNKNRQNAHGFVPHRKPMANSRGSSSTERNIPNHYSYASGPYQHYSSGAKHTSSEQNARGQHHEHSVQYNSWQNAHGFVPHRRPMVSSSGNFSTERNTLNHNSNVRESNPHCYRSESNQQFEVHSAINSLLSTSKPSVPQFHSRTLLPFNSAYSSSGASSNANRQIDSRQFPSISSVDMPGKVEPNQRHFSSGRKVESPSETLQDKFVRAKSACNKKKKATRKQTDRSLLSRYSRYAHKKNIFHQKKNLPEPDLLLFSRKNTNQEPEFRESDDEESLVSRCSSPESMLSSRISDDNEESSDESHFSQTSSVQSQCEYIYPYITKSFVQPPNKCISGQVRYISVYWDMENCPVPCDKSAADIVKKIRDSFYDGRVENSFIAVGDTQNLSLKTATELSESYVDLIHVNVESNNSSVVRIKNLMQEFQFRQEFKDAAVVLLCGDADYPLHEMRYKHSIYIYLICSQTARKVLKEAAHHCISFEDFVKDLPTCSSLDNAKFYLVVSDLPSYIKKKEIKSLLMNKIFTLKGKVQSLPYNQLKIVFTSENACKRAYEILKDTSVFGSKISVEFGDKDIYKNSSETNFTLINSKSSVESQPFVVERSKRENDQSKMLYETMKPKQDSKSATMCVYVSYKQGEIDFWTMKFCELFKREDIDIEWTDNVLGGCFLIQFPSLSQAQKARKVLESNQKKDDAPKFIKLVKKDNDLSSLTGMDQGLKHVLSNKVAEMIEFVNRRRENLLVKFEADLKSLKSPLRGSTEEYAAMSSKQNELMEQKFEFFDFAVQTCERLRNIDVYSHGAETKIDEAVKDFSYECVCFENRLPIYAKRTMIINKIKSHQVSVIQAETGSGKSTQICQYLWRAGFGKSGLIICTQPRKIAALSLAKHVSSQVACHVGSTVGYQVGSSKKLCNETEILFVTDFTMLKMCSNDPLFMKVSCIIIDEAHERSIHTDLLLGMIKRSLYRRPGMKVIITSATLKVNLFQEYFHLPNDAMIKVSGRTFPIEDVWLSCDVQVGWNYMDEVLSIAQKLLDQEMGDVLAFLPTPAETEKAAESFGNLVKNKKHRLSIHYLHGKMDAQEQQKIFEKTPPNTRKVVFATNCAETSVTIPGIRYVIDSGMVKESKYDAVRNLNVLAVGFVNKSSAEQRRGRAGRTQSGKCYRLYSHNNYDNDMEANMIPEILRVNLGQAILKLMLLGVTDPLDFDYVESPSPDALAAAMKQLEYLGAVNQIYGTLTPLGRQIAALPLEPRLCYLTLKGIEKGFGYEAVMVAALATVSRNIFFRNTENRDDADLKKVRFCQSESDYLTYLEIYKEWFDVPKAGKSRWCVANCINGRSMKSAHELINELISVFSSDLKIKIPTKFTNDASFQAAIHKIVFHSFAENICIYSGNNKLGYLSLGIPGSLVIHPSSSLCSLGKWRPKYVVYDSILKTSQSFLINVTAVDDKMLQEAIQEDRLKLDINQLRNLPPAPIVFSGLGCHVLKCLIGTKGTQLKLHENMLKKMCQGRAYAIDLNFDEGKLCIYVPFEYRDFVKNYFEELFKVHRQNLLAEEKVVGDFINIPSLSVILHSGGEIRDVILPGEYRHVLVSPPDVNSEIVVKALEKFGEIVYLKTNKRGHIVTYRSTASAKKAVENCSQLNSSFTIKPGSSLAPSEPTAFFKILITLLRRPCKGYGFLAITPITRLSEVSYSFNCHPIMYKLCSLSTSFSKKCPSDIFIKNIPTNVDEDELKSIISERLPEGIEIAKFILVREKEFDSSASDIDAYRTQLMAVFEQFTSHNKLHVDVKQPKPKDKYWKACVYFNNPHDGQHAVNALKSKSFKLRDALETIMGMKPILETTLFCSKNVYDAIESEINDALKFFNCEAGDNKLDINAKVIDSGQRVLINIFSNNISDIIDAKKALQRLVQGSPIECSGNSLLEKLFTEKSKKFLNQLSTKLPNCFISMNHQSKIITLFGNETSCEKVKLQLNAHLDSLVEKGISVDISLLSSTTSKSLLKEVIGQYGLNLEKLCEACGLSSAKVNVHKLMLTVCGSESSISQCKAIIEKISSEIGVLAQPSVEGETCPVCFCEVEAPFYRLEYCGHAYCEICILSQLNSIDAMPILCCYENCSEQFVMKDFYWAIRKVNVLKNKLYAKALDSFMKNSKEVKYCPTPDCSMIYRVSVVNQEYGTTCLSCLNNICTKCGEIYHVGMSCDLNQLKRDDNASLRVWMKADPKHRKICPSCRSPIEKNGGCLHMTCWHCKSHMCWRCMKIFPTGEHVYMHQPKCTGM